MRCMPTVAVITLWSLTACATKAVPDTVVPVSSDMAADSTPIQSAQDPEIENNVPISAEATTGVVPGKEEDITKETTPGAATATKPDRIYTDGALASPEPKAEDLGLASPGNKTVIDTK